ncbi:MAG: ABC transporter permease subunit [Spirochaetes bacterium]|nr:ABC transporter permease subunit [Spirochaetota bacterium]
MKNKIFYFIFISTTVLLGLAFLFLLFSLIYEIKAEGYQFSIDPGQLFFVIKLSVFTATLSSIIAILVAIPVSFLLARHQFPGKVFLDTLFDMTIVVSPIAIGAMLLIFFNTFIGRMMDNYFKFVFEVKGIILAQFFVIIGYAIRFMKASFESVDKEYQDIARTLGANSFHTFSRIVLPLSKKGIVTTFLLVWARAIGEFGATVTVAGATTMKTETLPVAIFLSFERADITSAISFIFILIIISLTVIIIIKKVFQFHRVI